MFFTRAKRGKMVDIHCHIVPGVDDGARTIDDSVGMLRCAQEEGIVAMIATPHYKEGHHNASLQTIQRRIEEITAIDSVNGTQLEVYPGNEVYYFHDFGDVFDSGRINTLNNTDRLLVEFSPSVEFSYIRNAILDICGYGLVPVVAHIERYECMTRNYSYARDLKQLGAEIQINTSSVAGKIGGKFKKYTVNLCKDRLVDYMGTDAHDCENRKPEFQKAYGILAKVLDEDYLDAIFYDNAMKLIKSNINKDSE